MNWHKQLVAAFTEALKRELDDADEPPTMTQIKEAIEEVEADAVAHLEEALIATLRTRGADPNLEFIKPPIPSADHWRAIDMSTLDADCCIEGCGATKAEALAELLSAYLDYQEAA